MEYIFVRFDPADIRDVLLDGTAYGKTEQKLMVMAATYEINLSGNGYTPAKWSGVVAATDPANPMQIVFKAAAAPPPPPAAPANPSRPRGRSKKGGPIA